jgi:phosphoglycolate phosphatase
MRAIIFDFDGTLADTFIMNLNIVNKYADELGYKKIKHPEKLRGKHAMEILTKELGIPLWKLPYLVWKGKKIAKEEIKDAELFKGIDTMIQKLQESRKVGVLTSNHKAVVQKIFKKYSINVKMIYSSGLFNKDKSLKKLMTKYGFSSDEILYVGDEIRDVKACKKVGIKIAGVSWGFNSAESLEEAGADFIAHTPSDILEIVHKFYRPV